MYVCFMQIEAIKELLFFSERSTFFNRFCILGSVLISVLSSLLSMSSISSTNIETSSRILSANKKENDEQAIAESSSRPSSAAQKTVAAIDSGISANVPASTPGQQEPDLSTITSSADSPHHDVIQETVDPEPSAPQIDPSLNSTASTTKSSRPPSTRQPANTVIPDQSKT